MNYLLVMPRFVESPGDGYNIPLGILYISAAMKRAGFNVFTLNLNHRQGEIADLIGDAVQEHSIDVVMCGGLSFHFWIVYPVLRAAKQMGKITITGGGLVTADPEATMQAMEYADIGVIGEGEETIIDLCNAIEVGGNLRDVAGIITQVDGTWRPTSRRKDIENLDGLAWPDYEGFELDTYFKTAANFGGLSQTNTLFMLSSRSCPYLCTFCFHTTGRKYRIRGLDDFFAELDHHVKRFPVRYLCISDELFSRDIERVREFCRRIKPYNIQWFAQFRVDNITPELVEILKDGNCDTMLFGVESADNRVLKSMRKNITIEQVDKTLGMVTAHDMKLVGGLIFGDLVETKETAQNSIDWALAHPDWNISMAMIQVYPGSYLYDVAVKRGIIKDRVAFLRNGCPGINVSQMTDAEFQDVIQAMHTAQVKPENRLSNVQVSNVDYRTGIIDIAGNCAGCGKHNEWQSVKLFRSFNYTTCQSCGTKHFVIIPDTLRAIIEVNFKMLLAQYGKLGVLGMNYFATDLFRHSETLMRDEVYPMDTSETVQASDLFGKKIYPPAAIDIDQLPAVVVALPHHYNTIKEMIHTKYGEDIRIINICELLKVNYDHR